MYLSKLELHGFKSFAERTVLQFDPGITAIVGPNGCGKSNIVDAVRWVIGEQRARVLRSEKMENVIFNGTSRRRPLGMAEVMLTVENTRGVLPTEYSEVTLGRRLYRSGDSDYLLNDTACRLKDITDLFMDTGMGAGAYSVIELKMVEEILSENAQDRRRLFEEAAGITRYKLRRRQTLSKLDSTQIDLNRVRDLTDEVEKHVRSLKRQAEKAARYKDYSERLRTLELALAQLEYDRLSLRLQELDARLSSTRTELSALETSEHSLDATLSDHRRQLEEREQALSDAREALNQQIASQRSVEAEQRVILERLDSAHRERERLRNEETEDAQRIESLERDLVAFEAAVAEAEPAAATAEDERKQAEAARNEMQKRLAAARQALEDARRTERQLDEKRVAEQRKIDRQSARRDFVQSERTRLAAEFEQAEAEIAAIKERAATASQHFDERKAAVDTAKEHLDKLRSEYTEISESLEAARKELRNQERTREGVAAEAQLLENLVASFEEFPDAVRFLAENDEAIPGELTTVADVIDCPADLRMALDAALGDLATCIVVDDSADVRRAAAMLDAQDRGRATFLVLERVRNASGKHVQSAAGLERLLDHASVPDSRYAPIAELLLGDVLVSEVRGVEIDLSSIPAGARVVTRDGEWATAGGLISAGSRRHQTSALTGRIERRDQLERVRARLAELDAAIEKAQDAIAKIESELSNIAIEEVQATVVEAERDLAEAEKEDARASYELETAERRTTEHRSRIDALETELKDLDAALASEQESLAAMERESVHARETRETREVAFREAEESAAAAVSAFNEANVSAIQARNKLHNARLDVQRTQTALDTLADRASVRKRRMEELEERVTIWQSELDSLRTKAEAIAESHHPAQERVTTAEAAVEALKREIAGEDERLRKLRQDREAQMRQENTHAVQRAEVQTRLIDLKESVAEDMEITLGDDEIDTEGIEEADARADVQDLRQKIRNLGAVNELALESYEEEKERLDFLVEQQRDLESAEKTLLETIKEINTTASKRFLETYDAIHASFSKIFADLFGEDASAELTLVDPDDPLETAIEITAKPRGKRPSTIAQLSGGEKTLTAIALLFAIYLVKPSPFCILDEVDAPLDDANVERFMSLIRSFADETQFILVTHNKRTMEAADRLYGITMQEQGVSKLVGVRFDEAVEMVG